MGLDLHRGDLEYWLGGPEMDDGISGVLAAIFGVCVTVLVLVMLLFWELVSRARKR